MLFMKTFFNHLFVAVGAFASVLTMISFFFDIQWSEYPKLTWIVIIFILLICLFYSFAQITIKKEISIRIAENFQVRVKQGDLFKQKGVIVIPVNDYFDTHVGDGIIDPKSVHGQFINNLFSNRVTELDAKISKSLATQGVQGMSVSPRVNGKNIKYPLGVCADVMDGGNRYVCVVTTEFDNDNIARLTRDKLPIVIKGLFEHLECVCGSDSVSMPVIGAGNARLNRSSERVLHFMIDYFDFSLSEIKVLGGVNVIIPSAKKINLRRIESIFVKK